ncbi:RNA polymerase sigma factor SigZ [Paenibacillus lautus]|uniref:RNA polymerase sigma factor SigZ n=1 Tax=Paenibacillus lautus TaxID=1401 RepID=UPI000FDB0530|nr:RNA polymerase sigma factor SigZ [Paenibacillus lautus]
MDAAAIWTEYHEPVKRFVMTRIRERADVDDIVQNVFMKVHTHVSDLKDEEKRGSWIFQIARNSIVDHYRKVRTGEELPEQLSVVDEYTEIDYDQEVIACFQSVLPCLPDKYREALELTEYKGMSQKELSEHLGISYSGAKSRVQRGREMMKELLTGCCHIESDAYGNIVDFRIVYDEPQPIRKKTIK